MNIQDKIQQSIKDNQLLCKGDSIIVGVSGGADSVCLLDIIVKLRHKYGLKIIVAHFNHHLRKSSDKDEQFVRKLAEKYSCSLDVGHWREAKKIKTAIEEKARIKRFNFLVKVAKRAKADKVFLAHHQDDLAETVLMRIMRGTGLSGLRSILPKRKINNMTFARPMLNVSRHEIVKYINEKKLKHITDPTNKNTDFLRNEIRLKLLPHLEKTYNIQIAKNLCNLAKNATTDYSFIKEYALKKFDKIVKLSSNMTKATLNRNLYNKEHLSIKRMLLREVIFTLKGKEGKISAEGINKFEMLVESSISGPIVLPGKVTVKMTKTSIIINI